MDHRAALGRAQDSASPAPSVVAEDLTRTFGPVTALSQLSVEMPAPEVVVPSSSVPLIVATILGSLLLPHPARSEG